MDGFRQKTQLADVEELVEFDTSPTRPARGSFTIENNILTSIIYKVRTTAPDKYRIRPLIGLIDGRGEAIVTVTANGDVGAWTIPEDRFQVQVMAVPSGFKFKEDAENSDSEEELDVRDMRLSWSKIQGSSSGEIETHELNARVDFHPGPPILPNPPARNESLQKNTGLGSGYSQYIGSRLNTVRDAIANRMSDISAMIGVPGGENAPKSEEVVRRRLSVFEDDLTRTIDNTIDEQFCFAYYLCYAVMVLLTIVGLFLYFSLPTAVEIPKEYCSFRTEDTEEKVYVEGWFW